MFDKLLPSTYVSIHFSEMPLHAKRSLNIPKSKSSYIKEIIHTLKVPSRPSHRAYASSSHEQLAGEHVLVPRPTRFTRMLRTWRARAINTAEFMAKLYPPYLLKSFL